MREGRGGCLCRGPQDQPRRTLLLQWRQSGGRPAGGQSWAQLRRVLHHLAPPPPFELPLSSTRPVAPPSPRHVLSIPWFPSDISLSCSPVPSSLLSIPAPSTLLPATGGSSHFPLHHLTWRKLPSPSVHSEYGLPVHHIRKADVHLWGGEMRLGEERPTGEKGVRGGGVTSRSNLPGLRRAASMFSGLMRKTK